MALISNYIPRGTDFSELQRRARSSHEPPPQYPNFFFIQGEVIARTAKGLTVDLNHPLAGETVVFELNLLSIDTGT